MPVTDSLELDITGALASVEQIGTALSDVVTSFTSTLSDTLASPPPLEVTVDDAALTGSVEQAIAGADTTVPVDGDTGPLTTSVEDAIAGAVTTVTPDADTDTMVGEIEAAAAVATVIVPVEADTSAAEASIAALGDAATAATGTPVGSGGGGGSGVAGLSSGLAGIAGAGAAAASGIGGVTSATSSSLPVLGAGAAAVTALSAAGDSYFQSATRAESAGRRFNDTFGQSAGVVNNIKVGDLDTSLGSLNLSLGSSTTQVRNTLASLGQLGIGAGATQAQIALTASQVEALSARAVALNPNLGSVGDVAERLTSALARGGRFAAQYGLSLTAAEIQARALRDTGKSSADELTIYDKAAAGAAIATDRYGKSLKDVIQAGTDDPVIRLRAIGAEFSKVTTEVGKPLQAPIFALIESVQPILQNAARLLGSVLQAILPIQSAILGAFAPLVSGVFSTATNVISAFVPIFTQLGDIITSLVAPAMAELQPVFDSLVQVALKLAEAVQPLLSEILAPLATLLGGVLAKAAQGIALAFSAIIDIALRLYDVLKPILDIVNPFTALADVFKIFGVNSGEAAKKGYVWAQANIKVGETTADLATELERLNKQTEDSLFTQSEFTKGGPEMVNALRRIGISSGDLREDLGLLDKGLKDFVARAIDAGQVKITLKGADVTAADIRGLDGSLTDYLNTSGAVVISGSQLIDTFAAQTNATDDQARANFNAVTAQQGLTDAQIVAIGVQAQATFGVDTYTTRLQVLAAQQDTITAGSSLATASVNLNAASWLALEGAVADGTVTLGQAQGVADGFGISIDQATGAIQTAQKAVDDFVANALSKFPTATSVFDDLKDATNPVDPSSLTNNLNAASYSALIFQANVDTIATKFPEVAKLLQEKGPEAAGAFAQTFLASSDTVQTNLETAIKNNKNALGTISDDLRASIGKNVATATDLGSQMTDALGLHLKFKDVTIAQVDDMRHALEFTGVIRPVTDTATNTGTKIGDALTLGIKLGMTNGLPGVEFEAREAIRRAKAAADDEAGIHSPSRLFAETGAQLSAGIAQGMSAGSAAVIAEAERIVRDAHAATQQGLSAEAAAAAARGAGPVTGAASPGGGVTLAFDVTVNPPAGMTREQAQEAGQEIATEAAKRITADVFAGGIVG
jgi:hypothetical protein